MQFLGCLRCWWSLARFGHLCSWTSGVTPIYDLDFVRLVLLLIVLVLLALLVSGTWLGSLMILGLALIASVATVNRSMDPTPTPSQPTSCTRTCARLLICIGCLVLTVIGQTILFFCDLCLMVQGLTMYGLLPSCQSGIDLCESDTVVTSWIAACVPIDGSWIYAVLDGTERVIGFAFSWRLSLPKIFEFHCQGVNAFVFGIMLLGGFGALVALQYPRLTKVRWQGELAKALTIVHAKGAIIYGFIIACLHNCLVKLLEFMLSVGSAAFATMMMPPASEKCDYHGDVMVTVVGSGFLYIVGLCCILLTPSVVMWTIGDNNPCYASLGVACGMFGVWGQTSSFTETFNSEITESGLTDDNMKRAFVKRYVGILKDIIAAAFLMLPLGVLANVLTKRGNQGNIVLMVECSHKPDITVWGWVEKGVALVRFALMLVVVFVPDLKPEIRTYLLAVCLSALVVECVCAIAAVALLEAIFEKSAPAVEVPPIEV